MGIRRDTNKQKFIEVLRKMPIVTVACQRASLSRATYYRWREEDHQFATDADNAIEEGSLVVNDIVESQLLKRINEGNPMLIMYYLNNRHPAYSKAKLIYAKQENERLRELYNKNLDGIRAKIGDLIDEPDDSGTESASGVDWHID